MQKRILFLSLACGSLRVIVKTIVRAPIVLLCVMSIAALSGCAGSQQTVPPLKFTPNTLSITPAAGLSFGPQLVGTASTTQAATLSNGGSSPIVINNIATGGDFSQRNACGSSLAAGAKCSITVTFTPSQTGPRSASIAVTDDTAGSPHLLALSGIGLTSGTNATLSPTSLNFTSQTVGTASAPLSVTLSNFGTTTLNIESIAATADFGLTDTCGASLASGGSCPFNVTFTPTATGTVTGTLSVTDSAPVSPQTVSLSGTCVGCVPQGGECFGPGPNHCCPAPRGHHSYCSNPTGWGTCTEN